MTQLKKRKRTRTILGVGYPWYGDDETTPAASRTVKLCREKHGLGGVIALKIKNSGAWKKYRLVLEEL